MAIKMAGAVLPYLQSWLKRRLPQTFLIHGQLRSHLRGQFPDVDFFVDRWPHPQAVVARTLSSGDQLAKNNVGKATTMIESMDYQNSEALNSLLWDPTVVDWNQRVVLRALPVGLMPEILAAIKEMGKSVSVHCYMFMKATSEDLKPVPIPEGVKAQPISNAEVRTMHSTWDFASEKSEAFVQQSVQWFPSLYLVTDDGHHVGHVLGENDGTLGMLYVNPEFRRKGYAKVLVSQVGQKYFEQGEEVKVFIDEQNVASRMLHRLLGFKPMAELDAAWIAVE